MDNTYFYISHALKNTISIHRIITMHYYEFDKDFKYTGESHNFWEMVFVDDGEMLITCNNQTFPLKSGEFFFHEPGQFHNIQANGTHASNVFILAFATNSKAMRYFSNKKMHLSKAAKPIVSNLIAEGAQCYELPFNDPYMNELKVKKNAPIASQQMVRIFLEQLLIVLMREENDNPAKSRIFQTRDNFSNHVVSLIIETMEAHIFDSLSISDICASVNYGKTYTCSIFKAVTGYSLQQYYLTLKIAAAKRLIREDNLSFAEISDRLCFDNPQYFSKVFKRITRQTPRQYRSCVKIN